MIVNPHYTTHDTREHFCVNFRPATHISPIESMGCNIQAKQCQLQPPSLSLLSLQKGVAIYQSFNVFPVCCLLCVDVHGNLWGQPVPKHFRICCNIGGCKHPPGFLYCRLHPPAYGTDFLGGKCKQML